MNKLIILLVGLLLNSSVKCTFEKISLVSPGTIILYAGHDHIDPRFNQKQAKAHAQEAKKLLKKLKKSKHKINYYLEYNDALLETWKNFEGNKSSSVVPLKDCAYARDQGTSLRYIHSETRTPQDFMLRDMFSQPEQFIQGLGMSHKFPDYFYSFSLESYLATLEQRTASVQHIEQNLSVKIELVNEDKDLITNLKSKITDACGRHSISNNEHMLNLINVLTPLERKELLIDILYEMSRELKARLLNTLLLTIQKAPAEINIIHVGLHHAAWLEEKLKYLGITTLDTYPITATNGFKADNINNIKSPKVYPQHVDKEVLKFIAERSLA